MSDEGFKDGGDLLLLTAGAVRLLRTTDINGNVVSAIELDLWGRGYQPQQQRGFPTAEVHELRPRR